jgi:hypothetical protein
LVAPVSGTACRRIERTTVDTFAPVCGGGGGSGFAMAPSLKDIVS